VAHRNDPRSLCAVNIREIIGQPLVLLVVLRVVHTSDAAVDPAEWASVNDGGLVFQGEGSVAVDACEVVLERLTRRVGIVGFAVEGDEICTTVSGCT